LGKVVTTVLVVAVAVAIVVFAPQIAAAIGASGIFGATVTAATLATITSSLVGLGVSLGMAAAASVLRKAPSMSQSLVDRLHTSVVPSAPRKIVFGTTAAGADVRFAETFDRAGSKKDGYAQIIALASHRINAVKEWYLEETRTWANGAIVDSHDGGVLAVQTCFEGKPGNGFSWGSGKYWTPQSTFTGCAYLATRYKLDSKVWPSGIPSRYTTIVEGCPLYDPRRDSTNGGSGSHRIADQATWTFREGAVEIGRNPALALLTYLLGYRINNKLVWGMGIPAHRIDFDNFRTYANLCEERVLTQSGATVQRYTADGTFSTGDPHETVINGLSAAMGSCKLVDTSGVYQLVGGFDDTLGPKVDFDENDLVAAAGSASPYLWKPAPPTRELHNIVRGRFADPSSLYQLVDWGVVETDPLPDAIPRTLSLDLGLVTRAETCQRIAKQWLLREAKTPGVFSATFGPKAFRVQVGSLITMSLPERGWNRKLFRVIEQVETHDLLFTMALREESSEVYAWDREEKALPATIRPDGYNPRDTIAPENLTVSSSVIEGAGGQQVSEVEVTWTPAPSARIVGIQIESRPTGAIAWTEQAAIHDPVSGVFRFGSNVGGVDLAVRARYRMGTGVYSEWVGADVVSAAIEIVDGQARENATTAIDTAQQAQETANSAVSQTSVLTQQLAQLDADVATAKSTAADLQATYGNTVSSKANADASAQHASNAQAADQNSQAALGLTQQARDAAADILNQTGAIRDETVIARTDAQTANSQAKGYRDQTSEAANTAEGAAARAAESERLTSIARDQTGQMVAAAAQHESNTASYAAEGQRSAAASEKSRLNAISHAADNIVGKPSFDSTGDRGAWAGTIFVGNDPRVGFAVMWQRGRDAYEGDQIAGNWSNRRLRITGNGAAWGPYPSNAGVQVLRSNGEYSWQTILARPAGADYGDFSGEVVIQPDAVSLRPFLQSDGPFSATDHNCAWKTLRIEDITNQRSAENAAAASAESQRQVAAIQTDVSQKSSAIEQDRIRTETARGQAESFRNQAATSEQNVSGMVQTVTGQTQLSAQHVGQTGADVSATAANVALAQTKATEAGNAANAANSTEVRVSLLGRDAASRAGGNLVGRASFDASNDRGLWRDFCSSSLDPRVGFHVLWQTDRDITEGDFLPGAWANRVMRVSGNGAAWGPYQTIAGLHVLLDNGSSTFVGSTARQPGQDYGDFSFAITLPANARAVRPWLASDGPWGSANHNCAWKTLRIEDVTSEKRSSDFADAASSSYSGAQYEAGQSWQHSQAASGFKDQAQAANGSAWAAADSAQGSAAITTEKAAAAAQSANLAATFSTGGGNLAPNTSFSVDASGWAAYAPDAFGLAWGRDDGGDAWRPTSEHTLSIRQSGNNQSIWGQWHNAERYAVQGNTLYEWSIYAAAHRCNVELKIEWYDANGAFISTSWGGSRTIKTGGSAIGAWDRLWVKAASPPNAAQAHSVFMKYATYPGDGDSVAWMCRPQWRPTYAEAPAPTVYSIGSGDALAVSMKASISQNSTAIATANSSLASLATVVQSGSPNLLEIGGFSSGMSGWWASNSGWRAGISGGWGQCCWNQQDFASGGYSYLESGNVSVWGGQAYTVSADNICQINSGVGYSYVELNWYDGANNWISQSSGPAYSSWHDFTDDAFGRKALKHTAFAPGNAAFVRVRLVTFKASGTIGNVGWRQVKLEPGQHMTAYSNEAAVTMISETVTSVDGKANQALARAAVQLDVNGYVSGWETSNNGQSSDFTVSADRFRILKPGGGARMEFINGRMIATDGSSWMSVYGQPFGAGNRFVEWTGPYFADLNQCSEVNAKKYVRVNGDVFFGGTLLAGSIRNSQQTSSLANNASVSTGTFGSNGGMIVANASWTYSYTSEQTYAATTQGRNAFDADLDSFGRQYLQASGGDSWTGSKSIDLDGNGVVLNLRRNGALVASQAGGTGLLSLEGVRPMPGDSGGRITWTYSYAASLTYTDPEHNTASRTYSADITRNLGSGANVTQRVGVSTVE
jgi:hypothetical protein